jgi:AAA family ATP:ADP antiporter
LRRVVDIRPNEVRRALLLTADIFLLLLAYYLLKMAREVLILGAPGARAELKTYAWGGEAIFLIGISLGFGAIASRVKRRTLLITVTTFFAAHLVIFDALVHMKSHQLAVGIAFFVWLGCFNVLIVAQFWSFANDLYNREDGERLFPLVALGGSLGALVGVQLAKPLFHWIGTGHSLLLGALFLIAALALALSVDRGATGGSSAPPVPDASGPALLRHDRYLALIAALAVAKNAVNALGEYVLDRRLLESAHHVADSHAYIAAFKSDYLTGASAFGLIVQLTLVSRILKRIGSGAALCILPVLVIGGYSSLFVVPVLGLAMTVKVAENGTDYSLQKTAEQALYLVTSRAAKYKAKAIVDTVFVRLGDFMAAGTVALLVALAVPFRGVVAVTLLFALALLGISVELARLHRRRVRVRRGLPARDAPSDSTTSA